MLLWALGCMYLFELEFSPDTCSSVGMLDHMVALFLVFKGSSVFKEVAAPIYIPTNSVGRFSCLYTQRAGVFNWSQDMDTTEQLHFHFSLSCIGERNGNPLQCSCLENPRDRGAWWAAVSGVTQSWTQLKWLCSSSSKTWILSNVWEAFGPGEPKSPFVHKQKSKGRKMQEQFL